MKTTSITINLSDEKQVMHSFGASDAWTCQFVGKYWPLEKREAIADLLFSTKVDSSGNPKGIGLSMWRFNIGAGSMEQGDASKISSAWHRAECFQSMDGTYDWNKQEGQQWFLKAAKARGVNYLLAFTNSPPVQYTLNGIAHSDQGRKSLNIRKDAMPDFAKFLAEVAEHFQKNGIKLDYISPVNEPQWDWSNEKQEGSPATNSDIYDLTRLLASDLHDRKLTSKVVVGEAGEIKCLTGHIHGDNRSDQIKAFWDCSSPCYLGSLSNVAHAISSHSYFTTWPVSEQVRIRESLDNRIDQIDPKLSFWQTEYCLLEKNDEIPHGHGRDLGMVTALYVARLIHSDLSIANATQWSWWLAISSADFKDGLVYIEPDNTGSQGNRSPDSLEHDGKFLPSKTLWALGNFSRFIRPGMVRVGVEYDDHRSLTDAANSIMASAYIDKKSHKLVVVLVNCLHEDQIIKISNLNGSLHLANNRFDIYTTSETSDLRHGSTPADDIHIPARSVVTLIGHELLL